MVCVAVWLTCAIISVAPSSIIRAAPKNILFIFFFSYIVIDLTLQK
jgi:hypothetical protein